MIALIQLRELTVAIIGTWKDDMKVDQNRS